MFWGFEITYTKVCTQGHTRISKCQFFFCPAAAKSLQSCLTLCDPIDGSPPGSPVPGILQPRTLEWVAISFSSAWKWKVKVKSLIHVRLLATPWTAAHQAPLSMGFPRPKEPHFSFRPQLTTSSVKLPLTTCVKPWLFHHRVHLVWHFKDNSYTYLCPIAHHNLLECKNVLFYPQHLTTGTN